MRIAFVVINANRFEGTSRAVLEVAERLAKNHEVDLWARTIDAAAKDRLKWIPIRGLGRPEFVDFASFQWAVDTKIRNSHYDIIHSAGPNTCQADVYTIQTVHPVKMQLMCESRESAKANPLKRLSWLLYDRCVVKSESKSYIARSPTGPRVFLPVSEGTRRELIEHYPSVLATENRETVHVVPNGADLELFHPRNRAEFRRTIRQQHSICEQDFVLLFSGGDWRRKGLDVALHALKWLQDPRVKLLVVGHDRNGAEVEMLVDELGLRERTRFAGFQPKVHQYYAAADLFLFPTMYEAFSLATIEAAASGLPVIMSDVSGAIDLIGESKAGVIVERDPGRIANVIKAYADSSELLREASQAARHRVEQLFHWDKIAAQTLAIYEGVLEARGC